MYTEEIGKYAELALKKPEDFGYWGPEDTFVTWGFTGFDKHDASSILEQSNFEIITKDLMDKFPDDFRIEGYRHWAVNHIDRLLCRILHDEKNGFVDSNITDAFRAAMEWQDDLRDYPVADESHFSEMEHQEFISTFDYIPTYMRDMINTENESWVETIISELYEMNVEISPDGQVYPDDTEILIAAYNGKLANRENLDDWKDFCEENDLEFPPPMPIIENLNQLKLFDF